MEFKIGDIVKFKSPNSENARYFSSGLENLEIKSVKDDGYRIWESDKHTNWYALKSEIELMDSTTIPKVKMTKKVIRVLVVNKKTGETEKNEIVSAEDEQQAVLKAFGVKAEEVFIKTTQEGSYEEDKPLKAIIEKK